MNYPAITLWSDSCFFSPYAMSVYVALTEKGIPFTLRRVDLSRNAQLDDEYRGLSLTCRVPTLQIDDVSLNESSAIAEYLEERFPALEFERLYPRDRKKRAHTRAKYRRGCAAICWRYARSVPPKCCLLLNALLRSRPLANRPPVN